MGGSLSTGECRRTFREGARNPGASDRLCLDEKRSHLGSLDPLDCRYDRKPSAEIFARQRTLLVKLIGGTQANSVATATQLLSVFGSIGGVLSAHPDALANVIEDGAIVDRLAAARPAVFECLGECIQRISFNLGDIVLQQWIVSLFKGHRRERIHLALLDESKRLIFDEVLSDGELGSVAGSLRKIVRSGISADASGVVLMHNHPSGNVKPSAADIEETRRIAHLLANLDMQLEDHLIVADNTIFSMRGADLL